jgi:hypothetical protein
LLPPGGRKTRWSVGLAAIAGTGEGISVYVAAIAGNEEATTTIAAKTTIRNTVLTLLIRYLPLLLFVGDEGEFCSLRPIFWDSKSMPVVGGPAHEQFALFSIKKFVRYLLNT